MTMCEKSSIIAKEIYNSLNVENKYIPTWFRYDKQGSIYNDICLTENQFYYMHRCEEEVLSGYAEEIVEVLSPPWTLADMGSGNGVKTRKLLNVMTTKSNDTVQYIPIDISEECLREMADSIVKDYEGRVSVEPVAGDYSQGVQYLREKTRGNKLILWLGGFQNLPYEHQIQYISDLADIMTESDRLVISMDITQDKDQVETAYNDPTGFCAPLYLNALHRLNRDYGSNIDVDKFSLKVNFVKNSGVDEPSYVYIRVVAKEHMEYDIPGLNMVLRLKKGDSIRLSDGKGVSCKYTKEQVAYLAEKSGATIADFWSDKENHVAFVSFKVCN